MGKVRFSKDPLLTYERLNERFFEGALPPREQLVITWVETGGSGKNLDTRCAFAAVGQDEDGRWRLELDTLLRVSVDFLVMIMAHEMVHIKLGIDVRHGSKGWNEEVRRLTGLGFFNNVF